MQVRFSRINVDNLILDSLIDFATIERKWIPIINNHDNIVQMQSPWRVPENSLYLKNYVKFTRKHM